MAEVEGTAWVNVYRRADGVLRAGFLHDTADGADAAADTLLNRVGRNRVVLRAEFDGEDGDEEGN